jgi:hypothetical protein
MTTTSTTVLGASAARDASVVSGLTLLFNKEEGHTTVIK